MSSGVSAKCRPYLLALFLTATSAAVAADNCDGLALVVDAETYGEATARITAALPELQRNFDEALLEVCAVATDEWEWRTFGPTLLTELTLFNAPGANQMTIYLSEDEQTFVVEYPFEDGGLLRDLPDTEEFARALICVSDATEQFALDPSACLPD